MKRSIIASLVAIALTGCGASDSPQPVTVNLNTVPEISQPVPSIANDNDVIDPSTISVPSGSIFNCEDSWFEFHDNNQYSFYIVDLTYGTGPAMSGDYILNDQLSNGDYVVVFYNVAGGGTWTWLIEDDWSIVYNETHSCWRYIP